MIKLKYTKQLTNSRQPGKHINHDCKYRGQKKEGKGGQSSEAEVGKEDRSKDLVQEEEERVVIHTPEYTQPEFSSPDEPVSEDEDTAPIQSHANIDPVTFDSLNAYNVQKLVQERDRLEFAQM